MPSEYFKVKIIKHTPLLFGSKEQDMWHKDEVGRIILVKKLGWPSAFYECKANGFTILKTDCEPIKKQTLC